MTEIVGLNYHAIAVLLGMVVAFYVMAREWVPITVTSRGIIAVLALGFDIFPYEGPTGTLGAKDFFTGFGHEALVAICALMVLGRGLLMTGALSPWPVDWQQSGRAARPPPCWRNPELHRLERHPQ